MNAETRSSRGGLVLKSQDVSMFYVCWVMTVVFAGAGGLLAYRWHHHLADSRGRQIPGFLPILLGVLALLLLWGALYQSLRLLRFGRLSVRVPPGQGPWLGRFMRGEVVVPRFLEVKEMQSEMTVSCWRREGSGKHAHDHVQWSETLPVTFRTQGRGETVAGFAVRLPAELPAGGTHDGRGRISWRLTVSAAMPGVDLGGTFGLPVTLPPPGLAPDPEVVQAGAAAPAAPPVPADVAAARLRQGGIHLDQDPRDSRLRIRAAPMGRRAPGTVVGLMIASSIFISAAVLIGYFKGPIGLVIVFGIVDLIITLILIAAVSLRRTVIVDADGVTLESAWLFSRRRTSFPRDTVTQLTCSVGMSSSSSSGKTSSYYDIGIKRSGSDIATCLVSTIREKADAEFLADLLRQRLGLSAAAPEAEPPEALDP